ncbi:MAG TPA: cyclic nucleotide-binding domain-containing protein [Nocardioidaceae bacterium]|nr:cyclic nucleotide-binding domain-containing protein [Nocardioidaceae bacterium]
MIFHKDPKVKLLKDVAIFHGCSSDELQFIAKQAADMTYEDGDVLLRAGSAGHEFLVLADGKAEILVGGEHLADASPGAHFGEISLLEQSRRTATVVARGPVRVLAWDDAAFERILAEVPRVRATVHKTAYERMANVEPEQPE